MEENQEAKNPTRSAMRWATYAGLIALTSIDDSLEGLEKILSIGGISAAGFTISYFGNMIYRDIRMIVYRLPGKTNIQEKGKTTS